MKKKLEEICYWVLSLTWGALMTIPGLIGLFILKSAGCEVLKNGFGYIVVVGNNWGGLNLGAVSFVQHSRVTYFEDCRRHEFGHSLQNILFGPLQLFLVAIPSVCRYWYQTIRDRKGLPNKEYDAIWFEGTATKYGTLAIDYIEKEEEEK